MGGFILFLGARWGLIEWVGRSPFVRSVSEGSPSAYVALSYARSMCCACAALIIGERDNSGVSAKERMDCDGGCGAG